MDDKTALVMVMLGHLAVVRDRHAYMEKVVELCAQATDADRSTVWLADHVRGELRSAVAQRLGTELSIPIGRGLAGHVAATGETINIPDAYADPRFDPSFDRRSGFRTRNILAVPVWGGDNRTVVGVIQVLNKKAGSFERPDQMLLERIASKAAPVMEEAILAASRR
ncbi:MAG: GAF domain-containing protein [Chloroflexi bacterium]|nr:GAF domain-containing protein [Chloroflexota bacterium]